MDKTKAKILIVDDLPQNLVVMGEILSEVDAELVKVTSGEAALEALLTHRFALILLDVQMPILDGYQTAELIRHNPKTKTIPIIFITAINKEDVHVFEGYKVGAVDYLFKPINPDILVSKVSVFLALFNQQRALEWANQELVLARQEAFNAMEEAKMANYAKTQFLSNMSHEIRTPMNAVLGFAEILLEDAQGEDQKRFLQYIHKAGQSLMRIINDILDLAKIESGVLSVLSVPISLIELADEMKGLFSLIAEKKGLELQGDFQPQNPPWIMFDRLRINQILFNLIGNALKFTESGFVRLVIKVEPEGADSKTVCLTISVEDSGVGIPIELQGNIFDPFVQVKQGAKFIEGTGLGLNIVQKLTEHFGGSLTLESVPGKGSHFTCKFSGIATAKAEKSETSETYCPLFPQNKLVLVVDDMAINSELIIQILHNYPYQVEVASDGLEAIEKANQLKVDVILMDLKMPLMDGFEATRILKEGEKTKHIPVVAVTADAFSVNEQSQKFGFAAVIYKPLKPSQLFEVLNNLLAI
ncbi:MAG: hypothetical protein A2508_05785 [Candidatus Lambdaproteobacteria bacterium RIFOXYD12_FULL_49_8]|nr:MAG: hypothetical protein A2508_05785 [Candidatus Lambdaproteobacteria bacterium RIFOXYD12_FULL_49_8]